MCPTNPERQKSSHSFLEAGFPMLMAIMQALLCILVCIHQAGKTLNLGCHGNTENPETELKITKFINYFSKCDPTGKSN